MKNRLMVDAARSDATSVGVNKSIIYVEEPRKDEKTETELQHFLSLQSWGHYEPTVKAKESTASDVDVAARGSGSIEDPEAFSALLDKEQHKDDVPSLIASKDESEGEDKPKDERTSLMKRF